MAAIIFILLGIVGEVINANNWFIVPEAVNVACFVIGGVLILWQVIAARKIKNTMKDSFKNW